MIIFAFSKSMICPKEPFTLTGFLFLLSLCIILSALHLRLRPIIGNWSLYPKSIEGHHSSYAHLLKRLPLPPNTPQRLLYLQTRLSNSLHSCATCCQHHASYIFCMKSFVVFDCKNMARIEYKLATVGNGMTPFPQMIWWVLYVSPKPSDKIYLLIGI